MTAIALGSAIADDGIRAVNFFNGRLLTGGDLSREQKARRLADGRLGQAQGPGVAWGLEVLRVGDGSTGQVQVKAGLGLGKSGQTLWLASDQLLTLVQPPDTASASSSAGFAPCGVLAGSTYAADAGSGVFLLTLAPTSVDEGSAPVLALNPANTRCNTDAKVEAVQLRLLRISAYTGTGSSDAAVAKLRNQIAYDAFAQDTTASAHALPGQVAVSGLIEAMRKLTLSECDVPLAVAYMVGQRIVFIDRWSVRRRLSADAAAPLWSPWIGERRQADAEARMAQFQDQITDTPSLLGTAASSSFGWLPPAGFLPAATNWKLFLGPLAPAREVRLSAGDAPGVFGRALGDDAVETAGATKLRVYRIGDGGPLMFARDRRNDECAEQVWLDEQRAGRSSFTDVQKAIDALSAGSCLHKVLWPGVDVAAFFARLTKNTDVSLCFEAGEYHVAQPLVLTGLGRVQLYGHGATLVNERGECALRVDNCKALEVHDIAFAALASGQGKGELGIGLYGALTVIDTPRIVVERVQASCAPAQKTQDPNSAKLSAVAIVVGLSDLSVGKIAGPHVTVADCELTVGDGQQGLLVLNPEIAAVRGNRVDAASGATSMLRGIVVAGKQAGFVQIEDNVVRKVVRGIAVGVSESTTGEETPLRAERLAITGNRVEMRLDGVNSGDRYGIFAGNAGSVLAHGNHVKCAGGDIEKLQPQAMRLHGSYGPQVVARDNLFEDTFVGIAFQPIGAPLFYVWAFQYNVLLRGLSLVLQYPDALKGKVVDDHNQKVIEVAPPPPPPHA